MSGPTIDELTVAGEPEAWAALGFHVEDGACHLAGVRVTFARADSAASGADGGSGLIAWSLRGLSSTALDGLPTRASSAAERTPAPEHPNGVVAIDHVVAISPDFPRSVKALGDAGLDLRRVREEPTPAGAPRQAFFRLGAEILELVEEPEDVVARAGGRERPVRFWGLALVVGDIDRTVGLLEGHAGDVRAAVQPGRRIATLRRSAGLSIPLALMSRDERVGAER
jgi:hypothetical protein